MGHGTGHKAGKVTGLIDPAEIVAHVGGGLIAGAVHERGIRELFGDVEHGIHIAETGRKNDIVMFTGHVLDDALGFLPFGYAFHIRGRHAGQGAQELAGLIMRV